MKNKYRISSNSKCAAFIIERQKFTFWRKREYWEPIYEGFPRPYIRAYRTFEEAKVKLDRLNERDGLSTAEWKPVEKD